MKDVKNEPWSGKVREIKSLTASITTAELVTMSWYVTLIDGRADWHAIERLATEAEIQTAKDRLVAIK